MLKDLIHAARMLRQSKGWTMVVLLSLALGIGANTALFTAVNGVLLQTVTVPDPGSLVRLKWAGDNDMVRNTSEYGSSLPYNGKRVTATFSYPTYLELRKANKTLTDIAALNPNNRFNVVIDGEADLANVAMVSGNYFTMLRAAPLHGRLLTEEDDQPGAQLVGVLSHAFWRKRFASDPAAVGKVITVNNLPLTVVGVTREGFGGVQNPGDPGPDLTAPVSKDPAFFPGQKRITEATSYWLQMIGRLKPGVTVEHVKGNLDGVFQQAARDGMTSYMAALTDEQRNLSANRRERTRVPELAPTSAAHGIYDFDTNSRRTATLLTGIVIAVLLIVCANIANLLLSRATARRKEIAVRLSMGASRWRLIRQLLTESVLLSALGGGLGLLVAYWLRGLLPFGATAPLDWRVFAFVFGLSVVTGLMFGLVPAFRATRVDLADAMRLESRSVAAGRSWLSMGLLVVQVALSVVLVIGAGLFVRTLQNLRNVDVGFNRHNLLTFAVDPTLNGYDAERTANFFGELQQRLNALPGVRSTALTRVAFLSGSRSSSSFYMQGSSTGNSVHMMLVSPEFFGTLEMPIVRGRGFTDRDTKNAPKVGVISEAAAKKYYPREDPLGKRVGFSPETSGEIEIVGIVGDVRYANVREEPPPTFFQAAAQGPVRRMIALVRTAGDPAQLIEPARAAVRRIDPNLPITNVATQAEQVERRFTQDRLFANALSFFGGLALVLAAIGLFGLMSYNVGRRSQEIGIRMALGARRLDVIRMVLTESLTLVVVGVVIGLGATYWLGRLVTTFLFGLAPTDAATIAAAVTLVLAVSTLAGFLPARRASRVDPNVVLNRG
jgi:predicted permease